MKVAFRKSGVYALIGIIAAAMALFGPTPANAVTVTSLTGEVTTDTGVQVVTHSMIELVDSSGTMKQVLTTLPGVYKADTTGLIPPILIKSADIFGYSETGKGVANVTTYTDAVINQIYQSLGTSASTEFISLTPLKITPVQFQTELSLFKDVFQQPYATYKISPTFNPLTTKFSYTGGFGKFFGNTTFTGFGTATQTAQATLGTLDWSANFHADSGLYRSTSVWQTQLPSMGPYSGSYGYTVIPTDPNAGATYGGVGNFFKTTFLPILKHEGKLLDSFNLSPLYSPSFLDSGKDGFTQSEFDATEWRKLKFKGISLGRILSYTPNFPDSGHNVIGLGIDYTESRNGGTFTKRLFQDFICNTDGTGCLLYGNQQLGGPRSEIRLRSSSLIPGLPTSEQDLCAEVCSPHDAFVSMLISDALDTYFHDAPMNLSTKTITLKPTHNGLLIDYPEDRFSIRTTLLAPFVYTNEFTYDGVINPSGPVSYDSYVFGYTFEPVNWLSPDVNGSHLLSDFKLGVPTVVKFLPPQTYFPLRVGLEGTACNGTDSIRLDSVQKFIKPTAKSASIIVPKLVMGLATTGFELHLRYEALYGQNSFFKYAVGAPCF